MKTMQRFTLVDPDSIADSDASSKPTHEEISALAHEFYQQEGRPDGLAEEHWLAAEERLQG